MKSIILMGTVVLLSTVITQAQISNVKTETVKVYGNCGMCESTIEKAANKKKISKADWNEDTKMATISYDSKKTTLDAVLKNIALAGYDNQNFLAPDEAYNNLPGCCKYERINKPVAAVTQPLKETTAHIQDHGNHEHAGKNASTQDTTLLQPVFDSYFALKDALVKADGNTAAGLAKDLEEAINAVKMDRLPGNIHNAWMKVLNELKEDAEHINGNKDLSHQRNHFMTLSGNIYELIKVGKPNTPVYFQHCPMANKGKGANWLSKEKEIKNPYYGSQMLTCGSTVETIH